jgi:hypothetical protein
MQFFSIVSISKNVKCGSLEEVIYTEQVTRIGIYSMIGG